MISVKNRVPVNPNRIQLVPISGNTYTWSRADNPTEVGTPWNRSTAQLMQADIRTLPIASGQTIAAKDVVNVVGGQITKAGTPNQAIALQAGTAGQPISIIFDGVAELTGITAGTTITSAGVRGYAPLDGWIWVRPEWDPAPCVIGTYTGNNVTQRTISLGFAPSAVLVWPEKSTGPAIAPKNERGLATNGVPMYSDSDQALKLLEIVSSGFNVFYSTSGAQQTNMTGFTFKYIAWR